MAYDILLTPEDIGDRRHIQDISSKFNEGVSSLHKKLQDALKDIQGNPSKPDSLANYQAALSEYTLYRNAQSNAVKAYRDIGQAIISNFK